MRNRGIVAPWLLPGLVTGLLLATAWPAAGAEPKGSAAHAAKTKTDDAGTTSKIKSALLADKVAPGMAIDVDTKLGIVTLSGQVDSDAQKKRAEEIAKKTKGVKKVINQLTLKPKAPG